MTITFFSNFLNIHQLPFCEELIKHVGVENFKFVATTGMDPDRVQMGFEDMNKTKPFVVRAYEGSESYEEAKKLALESDVAIMGSAPVDFTKIRLNANRLTFQYTERLLKLGWKVFLHPGFIRSYYERFFKYRKKKMYVLCASAYTAPDLQCLGFPRKKCFKWGYFPEITYGAKHLEENDKGLKHPQGVSILWAGRLIGLKHPEAAISLAKKLERNGYNYTMTIIGDGELRPSLEKMIADSSLSERVQMLGALPHEDVMDAMKNADIYIFTSDRNEGWGAVLNEAMDAGCVVVASDAIGSAPFLIKDGVNGFLFKDGDINDLFKKVSALIDPPSRVETISQKAIDTIRGEWSIQQASNNLLTLIDCLISGKPTAIKSGPCSPA